MEKIKRTTKTHNIEKMKITRFGFNSNSVFTIFYVNEDGEEEMLNLGKGEASELKMFLTRVEI